MADQNVTLDLQFKRWTIADLEVKDTRRGLELQYDIETKAMIRENLSGFVMQLRTAVRTNDVPQGTPNVALISVECEIATDGMRQFIKGDQAQIPNELFAMMANFLGHTARGALLVAGKGTSLEDSPFPVIDFTSMGMQAQQTSGPIDPKRVN